MGYYTRYSLSLQKLDGIGVARPLYDDKILAELAGYAIDENGDSLDTCKWYDHEDELKAVSQQHPDVVFVLHGEGENSGDIWNKYFLNGKVQVERAKIVIGDFDRSQLK